ncbi:hypothetical protein GAPWKB30_1930 [Gilliamella apicola]|nr:hypothetical protein [Gilliamella apicola]KDN09462.1 hypothetical protein GAPWKB30_1930 [Gilliamella apicola]
MVLSWNVGSPSHVLWKMDYRLHLVFTAGLLGIGWFLDLFLTSGMLDYANCIYKSKYNQSQNNISIQINNPCHTESSTHVINEKNS